MKYEFAVASLYHMSGAGPEHIGSLRFATYAEAQAFADDLDECIPTIYIIIDDKYAFYCEPYAVGTYLDEDSVIPWVYSIKSHPWGQVETRIWWEALKQNPAVFYHLAVGEIGG